MAKFNYRTLLMAPTKRGLWRLDCPAPADGMNFGISVGVNDSYVVVGANDPNDGGVYVYSWKTAGLVQSVLEVSAADKKLTGGFGRTVVVNGDLVLVGAPTSTTNNSIDEGGRVYQYSLADVPNMHPAPTHLESAKPTSGGVFGKAIASAGNIVVVGAPGEGHTYSYEGAAYLFAYDPKTKAIVYKAKLANDPQTNAEFGTSVATDGQYIAVGSPKRAYQTYEEQAGIVDLFKATGEHITTLSLKNPVAGDRFGAAVAIRNGTLYVGAPGRTASKSIQAGIVFQYEASTGNPAGDDIENHKPADRTGFGEWITPTENFIAITCSPHGMSTDQAQFIQLFLANGMYITEVSSLPEQPMDAYALNSPPYEGAVVAAYDNHLVVGAWAETIQGIQNSGAVYRYDLAQYLPIVPPPPSPRPPRASSAELPASRPGSFVR